MFITRLEYFGHLFLKGTLLPEGSFNVCSIDNSPDLSTSSGSLKLVFDSMSATLRTSFSHICTQRYTNVCILTHAHAFEFLDAVANQQTVKCVCNHCTPSHDEMYHQVGNVNRSKSVSEGFTGLTSYTGHDVIFIQTMVRSRKEYGVAERMKPLNRVTVCLCPS